MAKNRNQLLLSLIVFSAAAVSATASGNSTTPTAYDMLELFGFPRSILPEGMQRYEFRPADGSFQIFLSGAGGCEVWILGGHVLRYDQHISWMAGAGSIQALEGVSVKVWFAWIGITEAHCAGDRLSFLVGPIATSFAPGKFAYSLRCRGRRTGDAVADSSPMTTMSLDV